MIEINEFDHKGRGIGKINNKVIFIENAIPGEIVEPIIFKDNKKYSEGYVKEYIKISNNRINPKCPYYSECGGCNIMHMPYSEQLKFKQNKINNIVTKYLNNEIKINKIEKCDNVFNYRNKITFHVCNNIGFFKNKSNELVKVEKCLLCNNLINNSIIYLNKLDLSDISKIICRSNNDKLMVIIETNNDNLNIDVLKSVAHSIYLKIDNRYVLKYGEKNILESIGKFKYIISPDSFFQVNINTVEKLYNKIKNLVGNNKNIIDLYCGTGSIGIYISESNKVTGIEVNKSAYQDAIKNKEINNIKNIDFICGDSGKSLDNIKDNPDVIIVDPPRNGLNKQTINNIIKLKPKKIIYVSCEPITLVRDLKLLSKNYKICEITPYDMFPNTYHVETICVLEK